MVSAALLEASGPPYFLWSSCSCFSAKSALSGYRSIANAEGEEEGEVRIQHGTHLQEAVRLSSFSATLHICMVSSSYTGDDQEELMMECCQSIRGRR